MISHAQFLNSCQCWVTHVIYNTYLQPIIIYSLINFITNNPSTHIAISWLNYLSSFIWVESRKHLKFQVLTVAIVNITAFWATLMYSFTVFDQCFIALILETVITPKCRQLVWYFMAQYSRRLSYLWIYTISTLCANTSFLFNESTEISHKLAVFYDVTRSCVVWANKIKYTHN
jgi:hypothetical protein